MAQQFQEKIVVDVTEPRNRNVRFRPLARTLLSDILATRSKVAYPELAAIGGYLPGERMTFDFKKMEWSIIHRLNLKENRELLAAFKKVRESDMRMPEPDMQSPPPEETGRIPEDPSGLATWMFHLKRLVECKNFTLVEGKLPSYDEIYAIGKIRLSNGAGLPEKLVNECCMIDKTPKAASVSK